MYLKNYRLYVDKIIVSIDGKIAVLYSDEYTCVCDKCDSEIRRNNKHVKL